MAKRNPTKSGWINYRKGYADPSHLTLDDAIRALRNDAFLDHEEMRSVLRAALMLLDLARTEGSGCTDDEVSAIANLSPGQWPG